jgi:hypothetical protein
MTPQWPWSVYSQRQMSAISCSSGTESFSARSAFWTMPSSAQALLPRGSLCAGMPKRMTLGTPTARARFASSTARSTERLSIPGMEGTGVRTPRPSTTKSG